MELLNLSNILDIIKDGFEMSDKINAYKVRNISVLNDCINELSDISLLKLRQAIEDRNYESIYNEIVCKTSRLKQCYFKSLPIVYQYNGDKIDELKVCIDFLENKIYTFEKFIPQSCDVTVKEFLDACSYESFETLEFLREQLNTCNEEILIYLIRFSW